MTHPFTGKFEKIDNYRWRIPTSYMQGMRVPGIIFSDEKMLKDIIKDNAAQQVANAAFLPGIVKASMAMPDIHWGYGLPIGGVVATDIEAGGVISPGAVGYDCNCGVRLIRTNLSESDVKNRLKELVDALFHTVPTGVGSTGKVKCNFTEEKNIFVKGAKWAVERGYGWQEDLEYCEEFGAVAGADPSKISDRAYERGRNQSGTLGSGNHFLEVQVIDEVFREDIARAFELKKGQITVMIHTGSRGLGHQVCSDYAERMMGLLGKFKIAIPDRQLSCAPIKSEEGAAYLGAMRCAANYAWANRQVIMHLARGVFEKFFGDNAKSLGMYLVYDVAHNIAKIEEYKIDGKMRTLCVHRKGATRAFPPGHSDLPTKYKEVGQPVIIPGDMGRCSYLLAGTKGAEETFYSTCFAAETNIITDSGILTIEEVYELNRMGIPFFVPSINKEKLCIEWKRVLDVMKRKADVCEYSISQTGRAKYSTIKATPDHKVATFENCDLVFKEIDSMALNNQMVCVLDALSFEGNTANDTKFAFLMGVFLTDGYVRYKKKNKSITFTQKKTENKLNFIRYVQDSFKTIFGYELREGKTKVGGGIIRGKAMSGVATDFSCSRRSVVAKIYNTKENLQRWVMSLDKESTLHFLAGTLDGDGTWNPAHKVLSIFNSSKTLASAILIACLKLGILPYVSIQRENCFIIQISEKIDLLLKYTKRVRGIPINKKYGSKLFSARQLFNKGWLNGMLRWPFKVTADRNTLMEANKIERFLRKTNTYNSSDIRRILKAPLRMQRIRKTGEKDIMDVYNLTVADNHNYVVLTDTFVPVIVKNCHGAGRLLSRSAAIRLTKGRSVSRELLEKGIIVKWTGRDTLGEEVPEAYKDVTEVVDIVEGAGISVKVARMRPLGVIKG